MRNVTVNVVGFAILSLAGAAQAESWSYLERPGFMSHELPDYHRCVASSRENINTRKDCRVPGTESGYESTVLTNGDRVITENESTNTVIFCMSGDCEISAGGGRVGDFIGRASINGMIIIPNYYYIWGSEVIENNRAVYHIYKRGTGPAAELFPEWNVINDTLPSATHSQYDLQEMRYEVAYVNCSEGNSNQCMVGFDKYSGEREGLYEISEIVSTLEFAEPNDPDMAIFYPECWDGQCMTDSGDFMGLDPDYPAFK